MHVHLLVGLSSFAVTFVIGIFGVRMWRADRQWAYVMQALAARRREHDAWMAARDAERHANAQRRYEADRDGAAKAAAQFARYAIGAQS